MASKKKNTRKKSTPARRKKTSSRRSSPPPRVSWWKSLSIDRKLDLVGTGMTLLGLLTLLSLLSANRSQLTGGWVQFLSLLFGWGVYILPLALLVFGIWLILRNIEKIPDLSAERSVGAFLLFLWMLSFLHIFSGDPLRPITFDNASAGGGYIGGQILRILWVALGGIGAEVVLAAWLLVGLALTLDLSIPELFAPIGKLLHSLWEIWKTRRAEKAESASPDSPPQENGFQPIPRAEPQPDSVSTPPANIYTPGTSGASAIQWTLPSIANILESGSAPSVNEEFVEQRARLIEDTLASFGAPVRVVEINRGPTITQFGVEPGFIETRSGRTRVRVNKITSLANDLALALAASRIRIQAPVPGHSYVGIEVPNEEIALVSLRDILESDTFKRKKAPLRFALGRDVAGHPVVADLSAMPHLLIAGTTGSGKSVCINAVLTSLLLFHTPESLRLVLVDPKRVELTGYNGIPHLLAPVVVDTEHVIGALQWMTREMDKRYHLFAQRGARNITDYNARMKLEGKKPLPYLLIVIDELADLMMIAPDETERTITRLAQLARATGIHMILATQRPSVDVVTGLIKANFPARIAFAVASGVDSRVILDQPGAEQLLGRGDMLYQAPDAPAPVRLQGVFVSDKETQRLVAYWRDFAGNSSAYTVSGSSAAAPPPNVPLKQSALWEDMTPKKKEDPLLEEAIDLVRVAGRASVSMLQRKLRIGYTRASRLVDRMEEMGIVSAPQGGTGVREILDYGSAAPPADE
jgi:S-DNA-T family DNA segregation ATPase FtsK/SpoIIIE